MVKQFLKKKSKRQSTKHRVKVERKVKEHNRKLRKEAKKNPKKKVKRKDPGIPNILPFKEDVLKEAAAFKEKKDQEREKKKAARKKAREKLMNKNRNLGSIMRDAEKAQRAYDKQHHETTRSEELPIDSDRNVETSRKQFYKEFKKVIDAADVVLEVLDARDPNGSRCVEVEETVKSAPGNKKLVLLLNKIDLVPRTNVHAWLTELRREFPVVAFKASTQQQRNRLTQSKVDYLSAKNNLLNSGNCLGADVLMKLLGHYHKGSEMSINVGVVGLPNTGKSSIINSLKRSRTCNVGAQPGVTKAMQTVSLDKHIRLFDSPGVVMSQTNSDTSQVLRNVVRLESVDDPVPAIEAILQRCQKSHMMLRYNLPNYSDTIEFLSLLATKGGKLKKGGAPDINRAARAMLKDWNSGKITYYTVPPEATKSDSHLVESTIVSKLDKEFNIDELIAEEKNLIDKLPDTSGYSILVSRSEPVKAVVDETELEDEELMGQESEPEDEENEEDMEEDTGEELKDVTINTGEKVKKGVTKTKPPKVVDFRHRGPATRTKTERVGGLVTGRSKKLAERKAKKQKKKSDAIAGKLSDALTSAFSGLGGEDYSFEQDFQ